MEQGFIHIYHGDGKGKTTAALGLAIRFAAYCNNIVFCRFMKTSESGELKILKSLNIKVLQAHIPKGFSWTLSDDELKETRKGCDNLLEKAVFQCKKADKGLLILDEIIGCANKGLVNEDKLISFLDTRPPCWEIVMTGRNPSAPLLERGDYITEMCKIRHPYELGIKSRTGIEK